MRVPRTNEKLAVDEIRLRRLGNRSKCNDMNEINFVLEKRELIHEEKNVSAKKVDLWMYGLKLVIHLSFLLTAGQ